ncbi:MAG: LPS export ABC transporter periplasmic protein LptC [Candidatus Methylomirabilales bacterium]
MERRWASTAIVALLLGSGVQEAEAAPPAASPPGVAIRQIRMVETRSGDRLWEVEAERAEVFEDRGVTVLHRGADQVRIVIFGRDDQLIALADRVTVDMKTKDLMMEGDVGAQSTQGVQLFSSTLRWDAEESKLRTEDPVLILREGMRIQGRGMVADTVLDRITIRTRISSHIRMPAEVQR